MPKHKDLDSRLDAILAKLCHEAVDNSYIIAAPDTDEGHEGSDIFQGDVDNLVRNAKQAINTLIEAELTEARKDELKKVGQFVQSHNLNDASKHKWYRYHADRVDELNKGKES